MTTFSRIFARPFVSVLLSITILSMTSRAEEPRAPSASPSQTPSPQRVLERITTESLRGHVSFLASDLLRGRGTPSRELDIAAEYIASQFRAAGLEPIGDNGYFQTADWKYKAPDPAGFRCEAKVGDRTIRIGADQVSASLIGTLQIPPTAIVKIDANDPDALKGPKAELIKGKVVLAKVPHPFKVDRAERQRANQARIFFFLRMSELNPSLVVDLDTNLDGATGMRKDITRGRSRPLPPGPPVISLASPELTEAFDRMPAGESNSTFSIQLGEFKDRVAKVRNVAGVLRGSDPSLKETYVMLSAHYDHIGVGPQNAADDDIFNGANDDASGTASVIAIANAVSSLEPRPRRSLIFITFYGEEYGMVGSSYYAAHPLVPLEETVAAINLEQLGRTDDSEGPRVSAATVTGFDFTNVGEILRRAGETVGVDVSKHPKFSDAYFSASDNLSLARVGVPAHTVSVAFQFPDYHGPDDEWEKLDYANMAKIDGMTTLGLLSIANDPNPPKWDETNPKAKKFATRPNAKR